MRSMNEPAPEGGAEAEHFNVGSEKTRPVRHRSFARHGALVGAVVGLVLVWLIMRNAVDSAVTDHSPIFPAAVAVVATFACVVLFVSVLVGLGIGAALKRDGDRADRFPPLQ